MRNNWLKTANFTQGGDGLSEIKSCPGVAGSRGINAVGNWPKGNIHRIFQPFHTGATYV